MFVHSPQETGSSPSAENKRIKRVEVKLNAAELERLEYCVKATGSSDRARFIREVIDEAYDQLSKTPEN